MCELTQNEIETITGMQMDLAHDGELPTGLNDIDYYFQYLIDCQEIGSEIATIMVNNFPLEADTFIEANRNYYHVMAYYEEDGILQIGIYGYGTDLLDNYCVPTSLVGDTIRVPHENTLKAVLVAITTKYKKTIWL